MGLRQSGTRAFSGYPDHHHFGHAGAGRGWHRGPDERATGAPVLTNASAEGAADGRMIIHEPGWQTTNQYRIGTALARSGRIRSSMRCNVRVAPDAHHTDRAAVRQDDGRAGHAATDVLRGVLDPQHPRTASDPARHTARDADPAVG